MTNPHINPEKTYALVVGIEKYTAGSDWNLNGPANDAIQFANWLLDKGVKSENIYLFVSPLNENRDLLNRRNIKAQAANGKNIYNIVISKLLGENAVGELLYVFWGGHGYKVNSKNTRRILWYSDTDNENCKSLDIKSLTEALKTSFQNKGFATQIYFIDTCAISVGHEHDLILKWESSTDDFTPNGRESRNEQFVLFASPEDEAAINDNKAGSGSFSSVVMNELKQLREGCFLPADLAELTKKVTEQSTQKPVYFWVHKLDGSEEEWVNSPIKSSGATSTTLITTPLNLDNWVGREDDINQLQTWLANTEVKTIGIQGFGGVGKSTLAVYLYEKTDKAGFEGKFWANVSLNTNFTVFAEKIITKFGGQVTDRGDINELVNDLLNCLNERRYLLVVDNLETLLNKSRQWQDSGYKQFFESWLKQGRKSTVLLTTQVKPILFQPESWWYLLKGMKISDGVKLLRKFQIQGSSPEKETAELEAFVNSVDGHPLILELVAQYLRAYCNNQLNCVQELRLQQFQLVDNGQRPNWENPDKCLSWILKKHFQRLNQNQKDFLLNLSVYRQPFSNEAARCMLTSDEKKNDRHLQELFSCSFLLKTEDGKYLFQLFVEEYVHQVIDEQSKDLTPAHWEAFNYYISHRKELSLEKTIEDVTEYLEAFYHLCQLKEYAKAYRLLRYFAQFVSAWGYYSILVDRYEKLMEKRLLFTEQLSQQDLMDLFITLGSLYVYIGNSEQAIKYHQESLSIARELGDRQQEAGSLCNLGHSYSLQGQKQDYEQAIKCYQQALPI
ncbi:MAG: NB-ARC domain-containing protein, partial [Nostoc sp.]|uniref:NB-ARC domain-containing protein n=1 Tax=Nostoc sp. TaxID=1180 RepID=UPI002FFC0FEB